VLVGRVGFSTAPAGAAPRLQRHRLFSPCEQALKAALKTCQAAEQRAVEVTRAVRSVQKVGVDAVHDGRVQHSNAIGPSDILTVVADALVVLDLDIGRATGETTGLLFLRVHPVLRLALSEEVEQDHPNTSVMGYHMASVP
jgi:hypothetical protein